MRTNERGDKDNRRNTRRNRLTCADIYSFMVPDINGYFEHSIFNNAYPYNSVSSYINRNGGKVDGKIK